METFQIFWFSGTGNAKKIASWFREFAAKKGVKCELTDIAALHGGEKAGKAAGERRPLEPLDPQAVIGIVSPVHGFNYPKITLDFIRRLPRGTNRVVLMNTRAGMKLGRWVTPGLTGIAFMLSTLILRLKGYRVVGQIPFDMPSNWVSVHPALRPKAIEYIFSKNRERVGLHVEKLLARGRDFSALRDLAQDILISPVAAAYYFVGRYFFAKSYFASDRCTDCGLCSRECPVGAITQVDGRPFWTFRCESCMKCMNDCPERAIETPHVLWVAVIWVAAVVCSATVYILMPDSPFAPGPSPAMAWIVKFLLFCVLVIVLAGVFYRIQQAILKYPLGAKIISRTSLTRFKFWGVRNRTGGFATQKFRKI